MMKLSCTSSMVPGATLTEKALNLKKWGYDGIGVFVDYPGEWNDQLKEEVLNLEKNTGMHVCEFMFGGDDYGHLMSDDEELVKGTHEMYLEAAKMSARLGGCISELEYTLGPQDPLPCFEVYKKIPADKVDLFTERFAAIASAVEGTEDSYELLEPCNRYETPYLNNMADCLEAVERLHMNNVGILADIFHLAFEEKDVADSIRRAGKAIKYVHLGDSNRLCPGCGHTDWKAVFGALKEVGFDGYCSLECSFGGEDPEKMLKQTAAYLKELM